MKKLLLGMMVMLLAVPGGYAADEEQVDPFAKATLALPLGMQQQILKHYEGMTENDFATRSIMPIEERTWTLCGPAYTGWKMELTLNKDGRFPRRNAKADWTVLFSKIQDDGKKDYTELDKETTAVQMTKSKFFERGSRPGGGCIPARIAFKTYTARIKITAAEDVHIGETAGFGILGPRPTNKVDTVFICVESTQM